MNAKEALIALNMLEHVGPVRLRQLLECFPDPPAILGASRDQLRRVPGIGEETAEALAGWEGRVDLAGELRRIRDYGCEILTGADEEYPPLLREIYDPPMVLYVQGRLTARDRNAVAVVGSRRTTPYGQETARRLAYQLAYVGVTVVSGGARGIDTAAHQGALTAKGRTVAVLGTGIDRVFPPENADLFRRVAAAGALVTQFPFHRVPDRQSFPIRNRIVAGMTLGTLVIEAGLNSGALITAGMAVDNGRQVFAVPGRIDSPQSKGCHDLIKRGAKLCESVEDVLSEFEYLFPASRQPASPAETRTLPAIELSEAESRVLACLGAEEADIDAVIQRSGLPASAVSVALFGLEMKRLVRQYPGKRYTRVA
ncbi:MAG TPA: DNA-processing protein DprA [Verrucomicrobiota bacterium]|nr:DNA-processing protein DprA [Verrucomicrobiota bacterium]HNU51461.1 DNA-processing protein DprA [Verrucomicrobiota bacterium]